MIHYEERFTFANEIGKFNVRAHTEEHPSDYGNGTMLKFDVLCDQPGYGGDMSFDVRYAGSDMPALTRDLIEENFGVRV